MKEKLDLRHYNSQIVVNALDASGFFNYIITDPSNPYDINNRLYTAQKCDDAHYVEQLGAFPG